MSYDNVNDIEVIENLDDNFDDCKILLQDIKQLLLDISIILGVK